ncbi:MAG: 5-(carboxyamino)imidazole ribonucleotide synthase [Acidobacteria bacterium]|nr:5-(carboxyamino)imidazole ribonucleotide synthase [Acidobacteriota bacterium]MCW5948004.1 5-(carboxyamino)imidazole ribonucleotide synthase [Pyrinomonadaceae bacterium]
MPRTVLPGSTVGVFGSGQLGRMFAIEARKMGYRVHTYSPDADTPTGQVADIETSAAYDDLDRVREFARSVDVITFEFENVPSACVKAAAELVNVFPDGDILHTTQDRLREKTFLSANGFPVVPFRHVTTIDELDTAVAAIGLPAVLKTAGFGYDGKGQSKLHGQADLEPAFAALEGRDAILEGFIDFALEVSVVCVRGQDGSFADYGVIENQHANHILDLSLAPARIATRLADEAVEVARSLAEVFGYVGTMCVEFFVTSDERLLINEIAPRPHNSGHLTFGPCISSQFEQQLRAVCGLPLGSTEFVAPAAMANLIGDVWNGGEPDWAAAVSDPMVKLHLYGKSEPRPGRKMGHLTATGNTADEAAERVASARLRLQKSY